MESPKRSEVRDVADTVTDISILLGETQANRAERRAAKARIRKRIKQAKKKASAV